MCRALAYSGPPVVVAELLYGPDSSLVRQAYDPKMLHMLNLGGFGMLCWDQSSHAADCPFAYRSMTLPMFDRNLKALSEKIRAHMLLAHVRGVAYNDSVTLGEQNLHPFQFPGVRLVMAHNGDLANFWKMHPSLVRQISPDIARHIRGNTDSEWIYALIVSQLDDPTAMQSADDIVVAVEKALRIIRDARKEHGIKTSSSVNLFLSNGACQVAVRFTFDFGCYETDNPGLLHEANLRFLSLWYTTGRAYEYHDNEWTMVGGLGSREAVLISSEPLTKDISTWLEVPEYSAIQVQPGPSGHQITVVDLDA